MRPSRRSLRTRIAGALLALLLAACGGGPDAVPLGERVDVGYVDSATGTGTDLAVTVSAVRQGTVEELEASGLEFDEDERSLVPYYVDATYENTGDAAVERTMRVGIEDADDNLINATVVFDFAGTGGAGGPCPDVKEGELAPGDSFEDCTLFLADPGIEVSRVSFLSQVPDEEPEFVYWQAE